MSLLDAATEFHFAIPVAMASSSLWQRFETLTPREREVFSLIVSGMLNKQVAGELGMAEKTVKVHRGRVMQKLSITSVAELVRLVEKAGVAPFTRRETKV